LVGRTFSGNPYHFSGISNQIPDLKTLKKEVDERFLKKALRRGVNACGNDDFEMAAGILDGRGKFHAAL
jgi:hypothetical protein